MQMLILLNSITYKTCYINWIVGKQRPSLVNSITVLEDGVLVNNK